MNISLEEFKNLISSLDVTDNLKAIKLIYNSLRTIYRKDIKINGMLVSFNDDPQSIENAYSVLFELINELKKSNVFTDLPGRI